MLTSHQGHAKVTEVLVANGAEVNAADVGWTALWYASCQGHAEAIEVLVAKRAEVNAANDDSKTVLMLTPCQQHTQVSASQRQAEAIEVLKRHGAM